MAATSKSDGEFCLELPQHVILSSLCHLATHRVEPLTCATSDRDDGSHTVSVREGRGVPDRRARPVGGLPHERHRTPKYEARGLGEQL